MVFNLNRGAFIAIKGMPFAVLLVFAVARHLFVRLGSHQVRSLHVRHRRQHRGGASRRHSRQSIPHLRVHARRIHRRHRGTVLRVVPRGLLDKFDGPVARALRRRGRRDRWYQSLRRTRQDDLRRRRWHHFGGHQKRTRAHSDLADDGLRHHRRACSWVPSRWTRWLAGVRRY